MCNVVLAISMLAGAGLPAPTIERVELEGGHYLLARPVDADPDTPYPLIVCLHGTETRADDILRFWLALESPLPFVLVAPQGSNAGWRETDLAFLRELQLHLEAAVRHDPQRVLLTGHSAGGAMVFHLLYAESFPATGAAVTANYVPPTVTAEMVKARSATPVFYAVGEADLNRPRMREGLSLLRGAGASVTVQRPRIGHVLDPQTGQAALDWFAEHCRHLTGETLSRARRTADDRLEPGVDATELEEILRHHRTHFPAQVAAATQLLLELQREGRSALGEAETLVSQGDHLAARDVLLKAEGRYRPSSLAAELRRRREEIEAIPHVAQTLAARDQQQSEREAQELWKAATRAMTASRYQDAAQHCRAIVALYPTTAVARKARSLLARTETLSNPP